jgi:hypothetical protein
MRKGIDIDVTADHCARLETIAADRNSRKSVSGGRGSFWRPGLAAALPK